MEEEKSHEGISRRELVQGLALLGLFGAGGGALAGAVVAEGNGTDPDYENLRKVLVERLVNTRYYLAEDGSVVVLLNDEVWPGDEGGAYHQGWLFDPNYGLKGNPHAALEDTVVTDIEHQGIPQGWNLGGIDAILSTSRQLGLLDDANLVYRVLREKIHIETHGAHDEGVKKLLDWVGHSDALTTDQKGLIADTIVEYTALPRPQTFHDFY